MAAAPSKTGTRAELLTLIRKIPAGRVTTDETLADKIGVPPPLVGTLLGHLSGEERDLVPWHRIVAKGGAIGRGPHRDQQFARLIREGILVSPAGAVQDLARVMMVSFDEPPVRPEGPAKPGGRSRGMKSHP